MNRRFVCAAVVTLAVFGVALADEFTAVISKVEDGKVTYKKFKFNAEEKKIEFGDATTLPAAKDVKAPKTKFDKDAGKAVTEPVEGGLANAMFKDIGKDKKEVK